MNKRKGLKVTLSIVLSLLMLVDFAVFAPAPAMASGGIDTRSALIGAGVGAAAGAGVALAAPAIGGAIGAAGGLAGVGSAIVGGVAAVAGGVVGAVAAFGGAIAGAVGAIGGFIAGIFASPLFIPALLVIGAATVGYLIYRHYRGKQGGESAKGPEGDVWQGDNIYVTPSDYDMSSVVPVGDEAPAVSIGDSAVVSIGDGTATDVQISDEPPASVAVTQTPAQAPEETVTPAPTTHTADSLKEAHDRYIAAYQRYTDLVTNSGGASQSDIDSALREYREAYGQYRTLRATSSR